MKENLYILLLEKEAANELSTAEKTELKSWLAASAENKETARVYRQILSSSANYSKPVEVDLDARFSELESKIDAPETKVKQMKPRFNWLRVAATFALLIAGFYAYQNLTQSTDIQWVSLEIAEGEKEEIVFSDGSKMLLNGGSEITYPENFVGNERRVRLTGEAFFDVEKNPTQPFIVELENGEVRVLGTSFNVDSKADFDKISVFVKTGTVQFSAMTAAGASQVILTKNETGIFNKKENYLKEIVAKNENEISWMTQKLDFQSTPLNEVLKNIGELYGVKISFENQKMSNCPIDLSFEKENLQSVLATISGVFGMELSEISEEEFLLKGGNCN